MVHPKWPDLRRFQVALSPSTTAACAPSRSVRLSDAWAHCRSCAHLHLPSQAPWLRNAPPTRENSRSHVFHPTSAVTPGQTPRRSLGWQAPPPGLTEPRKHMQWLIHDLRGEAEQENHTSGRFTSRSRSSRSSSSRTATGAGTRRHPWRPPRCPDTGRCASPGARSTRCCTHGFRPPRGIAFLHVGQSSRRGWDVLRAPRALRLRGDAEPGRRDDDGRIDDAGAIARAFRRTSARSMRADVPGPRRPWR